MGESKTTGVKATIIMQAIAKFGGLKALGGIMSSRKGIFGLLAIGISYWLLLGRLPVDAAPEVVASMGQLFVTLVGAVSALYIGGTALEDGLEKKGRAEGEAANPMAKVASAAIIEASKDGKMDVKGFLGGLLREELANRITQKK